MANEDIREVVISDIPSDTDEQDLCLYLEDEKGGGGTIEKIQYDEASRTAVVEFKRFEVARRLLEAKKFYISAVKRHVTISSRAGDVSFDTRDSSDEKFESDEDDYSQDDSASKTSSDQQGSCSVFIEDVSKDMCDFLGVVIESKFGECQIEPDDLLGGVLVTFREAEDATNLLAAGHVEFNNSLLSVVSPPRSNQQQQPRDDSAMRKVLVRGLPASLSSSTLIQVLESPKAKGGAVEEICDRSQDSAVVTFREAEVAERLIETGEATFGKSVLRFSRPPVRNIEEDFSREPSVNDEQTSSLQGKSEDTENDTSTSCTVNVTNIPKKLLKEGVLKMFFENSSRSGGGVIENMSLNRDSATATITFKDSQVAKSLLERREVKYLDGSIMNIVPLTTDVTSSGRQDDESSLKSKLPEPRTIEVTELTKEMNEDRLTLYFESKTKSGGGDVEDVTIQGKTAYVTFSDSSVARNVASRKTHHLCNAPLRVVLLQSWPEKVSFAISVQGLRDGTTTETIRLLFENRKRSGGDTIADIFQDEETGSVVITYENREVAERVVAKKQLTLDGCQLKIEPMKPGRPPPLFIEANGEVVADDSLLFVDLPRTCRADTLRQFVAEAGNAQVTDVCFGTKPGVALVKYTQAPDYDRVLMTLCSKPYQGRMISVERLPQTKFIQIHNIGKETDETILLYFESPRNGGGDVLSCKCSPDGYALVEFEDVKVMNSVLSRQHKIGEQKLIIAPYYPRLGVLPPGFDSSTPFPVIPPDVLLDASPEVIHYICNKNKQMKQQIEERLKSNCCFIEWPKKRTEKVKLHCTVTPNQPNAYSLIRGWTEKCSAIVQEELSKVKMIKVEVLQEIWKQLKDKIETKLGPSDTMAFLVHWDQKGGVVHVCGLCEQVEKYQSTLCQVKADLEAELAKAKQQIKEKFELKPYQIDVIKKIDWGKDVEINFTTTSVELVGQSKMVANVKMNVLQTVSSLTNACCSHTSSLLKFLEKPPVREHLLESFDRRQLKVTYSTSGNDLTVYGLNQNEVDEAVKLVKSEILEKRIGIESGIDEALRSDKWQKLSKKIQKEHKLSEVFTDATSIVILTVRSQFDSIHSKILDFLDKDVIVEEFVVVQAGVIEVLKEYAMAEIDKIMSKLMQFKVAIVPVAAAESCGYRVRGNKDGVREAKKSMKQLADGVTTKELLFKERSQLKFLKEPSNRITVTAAARRHSAVAKFSDELKFDRTSGKTEPYMYSKANIGSGKVIQLMIGDITRCPSDVIVNAANAQLAHGAGVAGAISKAGGPEVDRESLEYVRKNGPLSCGRVCVTTAGNMPFKKIVHSVGPMWHGGKNNEEEDLEKAVRSALSKCEELRFQSVTFPAISCGIYGFPLDRASHIILKNICEFLKKSNNVKFVKLVAGQDKIHHFHTKLSAWATVELVTPAGPNSTFKVYTEPSSDSDSGSETELNQSAGNVAAWKAVGGSSSLNTSEGITVELVKGSIATQKTDVIFCSSDKSLNLSRGTIGKTILEKAGPELSQECQKKFPTGIEFGKVVQIDGFGLKCQKIYLGACPKWDDNNGRTEKTLRQLVSSSLEMASNDNLASISFPSIGTGMLKVPHDVVARAVVDEVLKFSSKTGGKSSVTRVSIVLHDSDQATIRAFESELSRWRKAGSDDNPNRQAEVQDTRTSVKQQRQQAANVGKLDCYVGEVNLLVKYGDITKERCDAIVNSTNEKFNLQYGALSKAILQAGGNSILDESRKIGQLNEGMAVTSAGNLPCKHIFHLYAPPAVKSWKTMIGRCLAEAEKLKVTSLVMPPLGTGHTKACSASDIAEVIFEELSKFSHSKPLHLKQVCVVLRQQGMVDDFITAVEKAEKLEGKHGFLKVLIKLKDEIKDFFTGSEEDQTTTVERQKQQHAEKRRRKHEGKSKSHDAVHASDLIVHLYAMSTSSIDAAANAIREICKAARKTSTLDNSNVMSFLKQLTPEQEKQIRDIESRRDVKLTCDKSRGITVEGSSESVSQAVQDLYEIVCAANKQQAERRECELLAKQAVWEYDGGNGNYTKYDVYATGLLEKAYESKQKRVTWTDDNSQQTKHEVSLHKWIDKLVSGEVKVRRTVPGQINLPARWDQMQPSEVVKLVQLDPKSSEYQKVENHLKASGQVTTIIKIERIQNPTLYKLYMTQKIEMERKNPGAKIEQRLWHGTASNNVQNINQRNFNRIYGGQHGLSIGHGVYFATRSSYSISGYSVADASGTKFIYQARVLAGKVGPGNSGLKEPPAGYDSVGTSDMVVVFYDCQAYPEYLITFR